MTINLDDEVLQAYQRQQAQEREAEAARQREEEALREKHIQTLQAGLQTALGDALFDVLNLTFSGERLADGGRRSVANFKDGDVEWAISHILGRGMEQNYYLSARFGSNWYGQELFSETVCLDSLRETLLAAMGQVRERVRKEHEEAERKHAADQARRKREEEDYRRKQKERAEQIAALDAVDAEIRTLVDARTAEARASLWRWPEGAVLTLYYVVWCAGTGYTESDTPFFDYDDGWTLSDALDERGYIMLMPDSGEHERAVKLSMAYHKPVWTRRQFASSDELPDALKYLASVTVEGICIYTFWADSDGKYRYGYDPENTLTLPLGEAQPLPWVREMVDGQ